MQNAGDRKPEWQRPRGIGFPPELLERLKILATKLNLTFNSLVRLLISEALEAREKR